LDSKRKNLSTRVSARALIHKIDTDENMKKEKIFLEKNERKEARQIKSKVRFIYKKSQTSLYLL